MAVSLREIYYCAKAAPIFRTTLFLLCVCARMRVCVCVCVCVCVFRVDSLLAPKFP
jgi:hypothetical protein